MQRRRRGERRRWKAVHFPLFDINNQLVAKNRRRNIDRRLNGSSKRMSLTYGDLALALDTHITRFVIGRSTQCDMVIQNTYTSRKHAYIECQGDAFIITDLSRNGTYIDSGEKIERLLVGESAQLWDEGKICLGRPIADEGEDLLQFTYLD